MKIVHFSLHHILFWHQSSGILGFGFGICKLVQWSFYEETFKAYLVAVFENYYGKQFFVFLEKKKIVLTWYYKYINNFHIHNSFKLKKNDSILKFLHQL